MGALGTRTLSRLLSSPPEGLPLSQLLLPHLRPKVRVVAVSCLRCWQRKDCVERSLLGGSPKIGGAGVGQLFRILGLGGEEIGDSSSSKSQTLWLTKTANGAES